MSPARAWVPLTAEAVDGAQKTELPTQKTQR